MAGKNGRDEFKKIPRHIAVIPDGNRRWARSRGLKVLKGHEKESEGTALTPIFFTRIQSINLRRENSPKIDWFSLISVITQDRIL